MNLMPAELLAPETCPTCGSDDPKYDDVYLGDDTDKSAIEHDSIANPEPCPDPFHTPPERGDEGEAFAAVMAGSLGPAIAHVGLFTKEAAPLLRAALSAAEARGREQGHLEGYTYGHEVGKREGAERCGPTLQDFIDHLKAEFDAGNHKPWNAAAGPALNFCARWPATDEVKP